MSPFSPLQEMFLNSIPSDRDETALHLFIQGCGACGLLS